MWELLDISIPAVLLLPLVACAYGVWFCCQRSTKTNHVRQSEFQRLRRMAMLEQERAERELEEDYMRHKQVESQGGDFRRRTSVGNVHGTFTGLGEWGESSGYRDPEADSHRRKQVEEQEQRRRHEEAELHRRRQVEEDDKHRKREEADYIRRREEADGVRKQVEMEDRKHREEAENELRRQEEEQEWQRRRADIVAQAKREAEEERMRRSVAAEEAARRRWKEEEARRLETSQFSPRKVQGLSCVVCQKPTRRRCSRCKSISYCSRECQVKHWSDGHKDNCRPHDNFSSPRSSIDGDTF